eukprot:TRINITY_DN14258_c0_g1_i2.p1 TRINITY_DN14258_c0_g1~~TRINITY_DN14258_c0_g1_i2.p1  ORF type:complete len:757 (+),score=235.94 TRINITY_DN14258_c0_g1_i2:51-2321(+)
MQYSKRVAVAAAFLAAARAAEPEPRPSNEAYKESKAKEAAAAAEAQAKQSKMSAVGKVVTMLKDLRDNVKAEGEKEAQSYNKFACFCKDAQSSKAADIQKGSDRKGELVANLESLATARDTLDSTIKGLTDDIDAAEKEMKIAKATRGKELKTYKMNEADLSGAIHALQEAIKALKASAGGGASMLQVRAAQEELRSEALRKALATADALGISGASKVVAFLSEGDVPMEDYKFHSGSIIDTLEGLLKEFRAEKVTVDEEEVAAVHAHESFMQEKTDIVKAKNGELTAAKKSKSQKQEEMATTSELHSTVAATLLEDQAYLKELSSMCQNKAVTWDSRSQVRQDELSALTAAIGIIEGAVSEKTSGKTVRLFQGASAKMAELVAKSPAAMEALELDAEEFEDGAPSFLQEQRQHSGAFLAPVSRFGTDGEKDALVALFRGKSKELHSAALTMLAGQISADPLAKVKTLIEELIERLLKEASSEQSHKGWCDKSISAAEQKRDFAATEVKELNGRMAKLEARRDILAEELSTLASEISKLNTEKDEAVQMRSDEKTENENTIAEAKEGLDAVKSAIDLLQKFYATAAKSKVAVSLSQQGPAEDAPDAGFESGEAYTGAQGASGGVIGMLQVIEGDFVRTMTETQKAEDQAVADHQQYLTDTGKSIAEKTTAESQKTTQKGEAEDSLSTAEDSLKSEMETLSGSVKELMELKPACIDTGMSYEDRVAKREEEVAALKKGLCILEQYQKYGPDAVGTAC